ncbi:MAG TPA: phosphatidate cytidylyltransferase [Bellilinea sp.]|nr:phosphatidate cytidylyltransferase [Bellilinea sp.]
MNNLVAFLVTLAASVAWVKLVGLLTSKGVFDRRTSRKIVHIGIGPVFVLCWLLFKDEPSARWFAAIVPFLITLQFALAGLGVIKDEKTVQSMARTGDRTELLRGPTYYGIVFVLMTLLAWKSNPYGIVALMILCGGDGLADLVGGKIKSMTLPWSKSKTIAGSVAFFVGGLLFSLIILWIFRSAGVFQFEWPAMITKLLIIVGVSTIVESAPLPEIDNITVPLIAYAIGLLLG